MTTTTQNNTEQGTEYKGETILTWTIASPFGDLHRVIVDNGEPLTGAPVAFGTLEEAIGWGKQTIDQWEA